MLPSVERLMALRWMSFHECDGVCVHAFACMNYPLSPLQGCAPASLYTLSAAGGYDVFLLA